MRNAEKTVATVGPTSRAFHSRAGPGQPGRLHQVEMAVDSIKRAKLGVGQLVVWGRNFGETLKMVNL